MNKWFGDNWRLIVNVFVLWMVALTLYLHAKPEPEALHAAQEFARTITKVHWKEKEQNQQKVLYGDMAESGVQEG